MIVVGIDPGLNGAIAVLEGTLQSVHRMPVAAGEIDINALLHLLLDEYEPDMVAIEEQQSMPKQGVSSTFTTGKNYGMLLGAIISQQHPLVRMRAIEWKRLNGLLGKPKDASRKLASELYPKFRDSFKLVKDDGMAEAALIARAYQINYVRSANAGPDE